MTWTGFDKAIWSYPDRSGKLPSLQKGTYPDLPNLPSKDLTIDKTPQHFTTRNIGNGFVVKVTSEGTLIESMNFKGNIVCMIQQANGRVPFPIPQGHTM